MTRPRRSPITRVGAAVLRARWLVRAPILVYRARLGVVFGNRLLMMEHLGRTSGLRRWVVLEVIDHPAPRRYVVASGFGVRAQWFRNIEADPHVRVYLASHQPVPAIARPLDAAAAAASLGRYAAAHPRSWSKLRPVLKETLGTRFDEPGAALPVVAIDLVDTGPEPPAAG